MDYQFVQPWHDFLPREGGHVITVFGSGGKTSLIAVLVNFYRSEGIPVMVTTTTRTEPLDWPQLVVREWSDMGTIPAPSDVRPTQVVYVRQGTHADGKWRGLTVEQVDQLGGLFQDRILLVEADGCAGHPAKLHRPDEPVWPTHTSLAAAVVGMSAVGRTVPTVLHRYGRLPTPWPQRSSEDIFTWECLFQLMAGSGGYLQRIPVGVPKVVVLAQMEELTDGIGLFAFLDRLMTAADVHLVALCELAVREPRIQVVCSDTTGGREHAC
jgi:probable selenium-dependent hydroxylase accessory protein YqeC